MELKICDYCKQFKPINQFRLRNQEKQWRDHKCRDCHNKERRESFPEYYQLHKEQMIRQNKKYYENNKEKVSARNKQYHQDNKEKERLQKQKYYQANKEKIDKRNREWSKKNRERERLRAQEYRNKNREKVNESARQYRINNRDKWNEIMRNYRNSNTNAKLAHRLRSRILSALKENTKSDSSIELLGCSIEKFKNHIENQFTEGMCWEKFGRNGIELDHIKPCCSFDLSDPEQQKICFHYSNIQPLWQKDNNHKANYHDKKISINKQLNNITVSDISQPKFPDQ